MARIYENSPREDSWALLDPDPSKFAILKLFSCFFERLQKFCKISSGKATGRSWTPQRLRFWSYSGAFLGGCQNFGKLARGELLGASGPRPLKICNSEYILEHFLGGQNFRKLARGAPGPRPFKIYDSGAILEHCGGGKIFGKVGQGNLLGAPGLRPLKIKSGAILEHFFGGAEFRKINPGRSPGRS